MKKFLIIYFIVLMFIVGCTEQKVTPSPSPTPEETPTQILMLIDEFYYDSYMRKAIDIAISDNTPSNCEFQAMVIERDRSANWGYALPIAEIEAWVNSKYEKKALLLYGLDLETNVQYVVNQAKKNVCIIVVGSDAAEELYYNYRVGIDYDTLASEEGLLLAKVAKTSGDILFSGILGNSSKSELTHEQYIIKDTVLKNIPDDWEVTFLYGDKYAENLLDDEKNSEMASRYLSQHKDVIGIVGQTEKTCGLWSDALLKSDISNKPLIIGVTSSKEDIELIGEDPSLVFISNPYAYYCEIQGAIACAKESFAEAEPAQQKESFVRLPLINADNYAEHLDCYADIYE